MSPARGTTRPVSRFLRRDARPTAPSARRADPMLRVRVATKLRFLARLAAAAEGLAVPNAPLRGHVSRRQPWPWRLVEANSQSPRHGLHPSSERAKSLALRAAARVPSRRARDP